MGDDNHYDIIISYFVSVHAGKAFNIRIFLTFNYRIFFLPSRSPCVSAISLMQLIGRKWELVRKNYKIIGHKQQIVAFAL